MPTFTHNRVKNGVNGKQYNNMHPGNLFQRKRVSSNPANGKFASNVVTGRSFAAKRAIARRVARQMPVKPLGDEGRRDDDGNIIVTECCDLPTATKSKPAQKYRVNNLLTSSTSSTSGSSSSAGAAGSIITSITGTWIANSPISIPFSFTELITVNWNNEETKTYLPDTSGFRIIDYEFASSGDKKITISVAGSDKVRFAYGDARTQEHKDNGTDTNIYTALKSLDKPLPKNYELGNGDFKYAENFGKVDITNVDLSEDISEAFMGTALETIEGIDKLGDKMKKVKKMNGFLKDAKKFNDSKIKELDVSNVQEKDDLFNGAENFSQDVTNWPENVWKWENEDLETFFEGSAFSKKVESDLFKDKITREKGQKKLNSFKSEGSSSSTVASENLSTIVGILGESIRLYVSNTNILFNKVDTQQKRDSTTDESLRNMILRCNSIFESVKHSYETLKVILKSLQITTEVDGEIIINTNSAFYASWKVVEYYFSGDNQTLKIKEIIFSTPDSVEGLINKINDQNTPKDDKKLNIYYICGLITKNFDKIGTIDSLNVIWGKIMPLLRESLRDDKVIDVNHYKPFINPIKYKDNITNTADEVESFKKEKGTIHWAVETYISYGATDTDNEIRMKGRRKWNRRYPEYGFIETWSLKNVKTLQGLFKDRNGFNEDITKWYTQDVQNMSGMFMGASNFNQNIEIWRTFNVKNMSGMFRGALSFNQPIGGWQTNNVENMSGMFANTRFNQPLDWNTGKVKDMSAMFMIDRLGLTSQFNQPIGNWDTINVENMSDMFVNQTVFNQNLSNWNLSSLKDGGLRQIFKSDINRDLTMNIKKEYPLLKTANIYLKKKFWRAYWSVNHFNFKAIIDGNNVYTYSTDKIGEGSLISKVSYIKELKDGEAHFIEIQIRENEYQKDFTDDQGNNVSKNLFIKSGNEDKIYGPILYSSSTLDNNVLTIKYNLQQQQVPILENGKIYWFSFVESNEALVSDSPGTVSISGTYEVSETLTATVTDADQIDPQKIKYQWIRASDQQLTTHVVNIGINSNKYKLTLNDAEKYVSVKVTYTDKNGNHTIRIMPSQPPPQVPQPAPQTQQPPSPPPSTPPSTPAPTLQVLSAIPTSSINPTPVFRFQSDQEGVISSNYAFTTSKNAIVGLNQIRFSSLGQGQYTDIYIEVKNTNDQTTRLDITDFTIEPLDLVNDAGFSSTNDGTARLTLNNPKDDTFSVDKTVYCMVSDTADFGTNFQFVWQRKTLSGVEDIATGNNNSYKLTQSDVGMRIRCNVSYTDSDGNQEIMKTWYSRIVTENTFFSVNSYTGSYLVSVHGEEVNPQLTLERGITYTIDLLVDGHPFRIQKNSDLNTGILYNSGLKHSGRISDQGVISEGQSAQDKESGTLTFTVPNDAPDLLYYRCSLHDAMVGTINIVSNKLKIYYDDANLKPIIDKSTEIVENLISRFKKDYNVYVNVEHNSNENIIASASWRSQKITINSNNNGYKSILIAKRNLNDTEVDSMVTTFVHELFHVFELVANRNENLFNKGPPADPPFMYIGAQGLNGYKTLINTNKSSAIFVNKYYNLDIDKLVGVPIEDDFGSGTQFYHWEEGLDKDENGTVTQEPRSYNSYPHPILTNEIMTGQKDTNDSYLTPMTAGALKDVGHTINEFSNWITETGMNMNWV
jgi:hypothetical protein